MKDSNLPLPLLSRFVTNDSFRPTTDRIKRTGVVITNQTAPICRAKTYPMNMRTIANKQTFLEGTMYVMTKKSGTHNIENENPTFSSLLVTIFSELNIEKNGANAKK